MSDLVALLGQQFGTYAAKDALGLAAIHCTNHDLTTATTCITTTR
ncbi:hypothetical protein [Hymenobacter chitinivorans]|nr:hypothetical protein [Hymenobacter chitinivorans]